MSIIDCLSPAPIVQRTVGRIASPLGLERNAQDDGRKCGQPKHLHNAYQRMCDYCHARKGITSREVADALDLQLKLVCEYLQRMERAGLLRRVLRKPPTEAGSWSKARSPGPVIVREWA